MPNTIFSVYPFTYISANQWGNMGYRDTSKSNDTPRGEAEGLFRALVMFNA
jgi:hypothetical protein